MPRSIELGGDLVVKNMKKLTKLTAEQQAMIIPHKEMWLNKFYQNKGIDKELATEQIKWLYNFCGQKEPVVMFMDSPFGSQILLSGVKKDNIGQNIEQNIGKNIRANIWDNIWANIGANIGANIRANISDNIERIELPIGANIWANIGQNIRQSIGQNIKQNIKQNIRQSIGQIKQNIRQSIGRTVARRYFII